MEIIAFNSSTHSLTKDLIGHVGLFTAANCYSSISIELSKLIFTALNSHYCNMSVVFGKMLGIQLLGK